MGSLWLGWLRWRFMGLGLGLIIPTDNLLIAEISAGSGADFERSSSQRGEPAELFLGMSARCCVR
jgi:hypothetical protein